MRNKSLSSMKKSKKTSFRNQTRMKTKMKKMKIRNVKFSTWLKKLNKKQKLKNKLVFRYLSMKKKPYKEEKNYLYLLFNLATELVVSSKGIQVGFQTSINFKVKTKEPLFFAKTKEGALELTFISVSRRRWIKRIRTIWGS